MHTVVVVAAGCLMVYCLYTNINADADITKGKHTDLLNLYTFSLPNGYQTNESAEDIISHHTVFVNQREKRFPNRTQRLNWTIYDDVFRGSVICDHKL